MRLVMFIFLSFTLLTSCLEKKHALTAKQELGKKLFFDPRLSVDGTVSCNSCHNVMSGGSDNRVTSMGVGGALGPRNSPTVFNATFLSVQFWDGRAKNLAEQAKGPLVNPIEMANVDLDSVVVRLKKIPGYVQDFHDVYKDKGGLTIDNVADAIADYESTLTTLNSPYDKGEMTELQKKGFETFKSVGCTTCHSGEHFAGPKMALGTGFYQKFPLYKDTEYDKKYGFSKDRGRFESTLDNADSNMFRVPTLRNIALTAPYFHNGAVNTLEEAVRVMGKTQLNKDLSEKEVNEIVAFLEALSGSIEDQIMPTLPPTAKTFITEVN